LWEYIRIVVELVRRDLRTRYAGSFIGVLWSIGIPALNALVLSAVFSVLMHGRMGVHYEGLPFALFYFAGFAPWVLFSEAASRATSVIIENAAIVKRVRFPLEALSVHIVGSAIIGHFVVLAVSAVLLLIYGVPPGPGLAALPLLFILALGLTLGVCFVLSALTVFLRDLSMLVPVALNLMFFLTPILYPPTMLDTAPTIARLVVLELNPWHPIVEGYRWALLGTPTLNPAGLAYAAATAGAAFVGGLMLFRRLKCAFADVL
jgi:ABC-type polysaccharide/polyol phosphate export permease